MKQDIQLLYYFTILPVPIILAITLHEVAHGMVARYFGDATAYLQGRLTLNPLKHIDPVGTVIVPFLLVITTGFMFGWARPVPVDPRNFQHPRQHMAYVAMAGPLSNFIMALFWAMLLALATHLIGKTGMGQALALMADIGIKINLVLMVLNLIPVPPLDGGRIVHGFLSASAALKYSRIEPYGIWVILLLLLTGILGKILWPLIQLIERFLYFIFGL
ncbi:MAG: site-2 protease family protein [Gammaproteobacteria bacterium]|nr:site-2 protease family protein [Gammaproteobacteria bacterium]